MDIISFMFMRKEEEEEEGGDKGGGPKWQGKTH